MKKFKTIVVDDHDLFRKGICMILSSLDFLDIVAEATDGEQFVELLNTLEPEIVIMDIKMPKIDGVQATKLALKKYPQLKILALSMFGESEYYNQMMEAGVKGFILKNSDIDELKKGLEKIIAGGTYFSQELLMNLVKTYKTDNKIEVNLSHREIEVLQFICDGMSNVEIADKLCLSQRTVESHRANILDKTGMKNSIQLVVFSIKNSLYKI